MSRLGAYATVLSSVGLLSVGAVICVKYLAQTRRTESTPLGTPQMASLVSAPAQPRKPCAEGAPLQGNVLSWGGSIVLSDAKSSIAFIRQHKGQSVVVRSGDVIGDQKYKAVAVARRGICLEDVATRRQYVLRAPASFAASPVPKELTTAIGIKVMRKNQYKVAKRVIDVEMMNLNYLMTQAHAVPEFDNTKKLVGFRLKALDPGSLFLALGLKAGDLITGANDIKFTNLGDPIRALQQLKAAKRVDIFIKRGSTAQKLEYIVEN